MKLVYNLLKYIVFRNCFNKIIKDIYNKKYKDVRWFWNLKLEIIWMFNYRELVK